MDRILDVQLFGAELFLFDKTSYFTTFNQPKFSCILNTKKEEGENMHKVFRFTMLSGILGSWALFYPWLFLRGSFTPDVFLPFELCNMMQIVIVVACWKNRPQWLQHIMYPLILGPIVAFSFPFGLFQMGGWFTVYFMFYHTTLLVTGCYVLYHVKGNVTKTQVRSAVGFMMICSVLAGTANIATGGNYMFLNSFFHPSIILNFILLTGLSLVGILLFHGILRAAWTCTYRIRPITMKKWFSTKST